MRSMILAIRLKYFYLTYKNIKTIEIRKNAPKDFVGDVYEYVSKTNFEKDLLEIPENEREFFKQFKGKVGLKFTLNKVEEISWQIGVYELEQQWFSDFLDKCCLGFCELKNYLNKKNGYAWHISNLVIFDKPKELSEFTNCDEYPYTRYIGKAPQSWCYCKSEE